MLLPERAMRFLFLNSHWLSVFRGYSPHVKDDNMIKIDKLKQKLQNCDNFLVQTYLTKVVYEDFSKIDDAIGAAIAAPAAYLFTNKDLKAMFVDGQLAWVAPYLI